MIKEKEIWQIFHIEGVGAQSKSCLHERGMPIYTTDESLYDTGYLWWLHSTICHSILPQAQYWGVCISQKSLVYWICCCQSLLGRHKCWLYKEHLRTSKEKKKWYERRKKLSKRNKKKKILNIHTCYQGKDVILLGTEDNSPTLCFKVVRFFSFFLEHTTISEWIFWIKCACCLNNVERKPYCVKRRYVP